MKPDHFVGVNKMIVKSCTKIGMQVYYGYESTKFKKFG